MMTRKLWRALHNPLEWNPVYRRALSMQPFKSPKRPGGWIVFVYLASCCGLSVVGSFGWLPVAVVATILLGNTLYALSWATTISGGIARERETNTYDLLCLSPSGALVTSWALCTAQVHRTQVFKVVYFAVRLVCITGMLALAIALLIPLSVLQGFGRGGSHLSPVGMESTLSLFYTFLYALSVVIIFFADHIQSMVLASLVGIVTPSYARPGTESRFRSMVTFLALQLVAYGMSTFITLFLFVMYQVLGVNGWFSNLSLAAVGVVTFFLVREGVIRSFWKRVVKQLNTDDSELDLITSESSQKAVKQWSHGEYG
jgi:hypothetical protein